MIEITEPEWFHSSNNLCDPEGSACYVPDLGLSLTKGFAPFPVFFRSPSAPRSEIVSWNWDMGAGTENDAGARYAKGFNAAHVFETPGTYRVTLTVMDVQGRSSSDSVDITVLAPSGTTYYVNSQIGNDNCDGKSATVTSVTRCPWKTAQKAFSNMVRPYEWAPKSQWYYQPGDQILFERGQTFEMTDTIAPGYGLATYGYTFAAHGNTQLPKPIIQWNGPSNVSMINSLFGFSYIGFQDLQINMKGSDWANSFFTAMCAQKNILFLRCDFHEPYNGAIATNGGSCASEEDPLPKPATNFFIFDSTVTNAQTHAQSVVQAYFFGVDGLALVGNSFDLAGNHTIYSGSVSGAVVVNNTFSRPAFGRCAYRDSGGPASYPSNNIYFARNKLLGWRDNISDTNAHNGYGDYNYGLVNFSTNGSDDEHFGNDVIFEENILTNFMGGISVNNMQRMTIRNNVFVTPAFNVQYSLMLGGWEGLGGMKRPIKDIRIIGNTFLYTGPIGNLANGTDGKPFVLLYPWRAGSTLWGDHNENTTIMNNIFYSKNARIAPILTYAGPFAEAAHELFSDFNLLYSGNQTNPNFAVSYESIGGVSNLVRHSLPEWSIAIGLDNNSILADPRFAAPLPIFNHTVGEPASLTSVISEANQCLSAAHLSAQSPRGMGTLLPADSFFDFDGTPRYLLDQSVDMGAFEYH